MGDMVWFSLSFSSFSSTYLFHIPHFPFHLPPVSSCLFFIMSIFLLSLFLLSLFLLYLFLLYLFLLYLFLLSLFLLSLSIIVSFLIPFSYCSFSFIFRCYNVVYFS